jgi:hypothetical protein
MDNQDTATNRRAVFHFIDGSHLSLEWPKKMDDSSRELATALREVAGTSQFAAEVDGKIMVIQMANVKYFEVIPAPERLPIEWIRGARQIKEG